MGKIELICSWTAVKVGGKIITTEPGGEGEAETRLWAGGGAEGQLELKGISGCYGNFLKSMKVILRSLNNEGVRASTGHILSPNKLQVLRQGFGQLSC